jgi:hypothetical protein
MIQVDAAGRRVVLAAGLATMTTRATLSASHP